MKTEKTIPVTVLVFFCLMWGSLHATAQTNAVSAQSQCEVLTIEGKVEVARKGKTEWSALQTNQVLETTK